MGQREFIVVVFLGVQTTPMFSLTIDMTSIISLTIIDMTPIVSLTIYMPHINSLTIDMTPIIGLTIYIIPIISLTGATGAEWRS